MKLLFVLLLIYMQRTSSHRIVDVYAPDRSNKEFQYQLQILAEDQKGIKERDIIIRKHSGEAHFKFKLTGKDGSEKYSSSKVVLLKTLYAIIDAMPMRKEEMSRQ